jgi:hypothetical protein
LGRSRSASGAPHPHQRSSPSPVSQAGASDLRTTYRCGLVGSHRVWPNHGPGTPRLWGQRRSASRTLAGKIDPRRLPPTNEAARAIALSGGAPAGSGPGTSPCIGGLSLTSGMVVPQHPAGSNHLQDGALAWTTWPGKAAQSWRHQACTRTPGSWDSNPGSDSTTSPGRRREALLTCRFSLPMVTVLSAASCSHEKAGGEAFDAKDPSSALGAVAFPVRPRPSRCPMHFRRR